MILLKLWWEFFKIGLFSVGGGMATLPFLYDMADRTGWFTYDQIADMLAVSESTPGPIGINMATAMSPSRLDRCDVRSHHAGHNYRAAYHCGA